MCALFRRFRPDVYVESISRIDFEALFREGYRYILFDLDNTLEKDHATHPSDHAKQILGKVGALGFMSCIVTNSKRDRARQYAKELGIPCVPFAKKPLKRGVLRGLRLLSASPKQAIFIGDQLLTDIVAAKGAGVYAILVQPLHEKEVWYTNIKRPLERRCLRHAGLIDKDGQRLI